MSEQEMQLCDNCGKMVAKATFRMHYMGCLRQMRVKQPSPPKKNEEEEAKVNEEKVAAAALAQSKLNQIEKVLNQLPSQQQQQQNNPFGASSLQEEPMQQNLAQQNTGQAQGMSDYDAMIFQQFMDGGDEGQNLIKDDSMQQMSEQNDNDPEGLGIRKADSNQEMQMIGGPEDMSSFRPMGGSMPFYDPGTFGSLGHRQGQVNAPTGLGLSRQQNDGGVSDAERQAAQDLQNNLSVMQGINARSIGGDQVLDENQNAEGMAAGEFMDLPDEELDPELQQILEMSRHDK